MNTASPSGALAPAGLPQDRPLRVIYLTSGAAGMYCGSCIHDNTLVRGLRATGVDVQLVPTYTPIRTDEPDASVPRVFLGGLNVYFAEKIPGFARLPRFLTSWLDRPGLIRVATSFGIQTDAADLGALTVSLLRGEHGHQKRDIDALAAWLATQSPPDVVHFTNLLIGGCIPSIKRKLGCRIVVTLQGDDIFLDSLPEPHRGRAIREMQRLIPLVDRFVVNSEFYAEEMGRRLGIPRERFEITPLTIDTADFTPLDLANRHRRAATSPQRTIGYFARLAPEKGLHVLVDAFCLLKAKPGTDHIRLKIAGWLGAHRRDYAEEQFQRMRDAGLGDAFEYTGEPNRADKVTFLESIDLLCVPTTYRDPKGLFALESLAAGTPVVLPAHGSFPEMLARLGGGRLVPPEDPAQLAEVLRELLADDQQRYELSRAGRAAVLERAGLPVLTEATLATYASVLSAASD
jgi:glycosyltransferase involved in cell wall biosynthesis